MGEKPQSVATARPVLTATKYNVSTDSVGVRVHLAGRFCGVSIRMDAHLGELVPKTRLEHGARTSIQMLTTGAQH